MDDQTLTPITDVMTIGVGGVETGIRLATGDATALHADLQARAVDVGEVLRWPGVPPMFAFHDQDGNGLRIVEAV